MVRDTFLESARIAVDTAANDSVAELWDAPSALAGMSVQALTGHLLRNPFLVESALETHPAAAETDAIGYYRGIPGLHDPGSEINRGVIERGTEAARDGHAPVVEAARASIDRLAVVLPAEPADRAVDMRGATLLLDEYLATRIVELVVHLDDLTISVDEPMPALPGGAYDVAIRFLVDLCRAENGDLAVIRGLARVERVEGDPLRAF